MALFSCLTYDGSSNVNVSLPSATVSIEMGVVDESVREDVPIITPYGFHSVPADYFTAIQGGGTDFVSSVVLGFLNPCNKVYDSNDAGTAVETISEQDNLQGLEKGETEIFNAFNYSLRLEEDKLNAKWKTLETRINNGENVMNLFLEIYSQMSELINLMNSFWTLYNTHVHTTPDPSDNTKTLVPDSEFIVAYDAGAPQGPIVPPQSFFTTIKGELGDGETMHIDNNGLKFSTFPNP